MSIHKIDHVITISDVPLRFIGDKLTDVLSSGAFKPDDRVIYRDETGLWHEMVVDFERREIKGIRIIGALSKADAVAKLKTNQQDKISKWPLQSWDDRLKEHK